MIFFKLIQLQYTVSYNMLFFKYAVLDSTLYVTISVPLHSLEVTITCRVTVVFHEAFK